MSRITDTLREVANCYRLGLRDTLRPRLAFTSLMVGAIAALSILLVFSVWYEPIWQWSERRVAFGLSSVWPEPAPLWVAALTWVALLSAYVVSALLLMQVMLELWLMQRIQVVCLARHTVLMARQHDSRFQQGFLDGLRTFLTWAVGGLLCLMIPVIGGPLLLALSSYLAVRSLVNDALQGIAADTEMRHLIKTSRAPMLALGILVALTSLIPLLGLLTPVLVGASTCHLMMGRLEQLRSPNRLSDA